MDFQCDDVHSMCESVSARLRAVESQLMTRVDVQQMLTSVNERIASYDEIQCINVAVLIINILTLATVVALVVHVVD